MNDAKNSISDSESYEEIREYWDRHDLAEHWDGTRPAGFTVVIQSQFTHFAIEPALSERLQRGAARRLSRNAGELVAARAR